MRDALVAGMTLNIFNKHSDRVKMACIAQLINVLQSVMPVSYTHLDVYKRQVRGSDKHIWRFKGNTP